MKGRYLSVRRVKLAFPKKKYEESLDKSIGKQKISTQWYLYVLKYLSNISLYFGPDV